MASQSPFGKATRVRLLKQHLTDFGNITAASAWKFLYEELLWIDGSTGLAHLYESDKAQPGRPWYDRTVLFTDLLCDLFGEITRDQLKQRIDRLFRACLQKAVEFPPEASLPVEAVDDLEETLRNLQSPIYLRSSDDVEPYTPDASLVAEFSSLLMQYARMPQSQAESLAHDLVSRARYYFTVERKRQNVLGEGFEDLLQLLIEKVSQVPSDRIVVRRRANLLPGFQNTSSTRDRIEAPDIAIVHNERTALLASVKWSLRHDRQKQLSDELDCYASLLSQKEFPRYVLVTNEYDPGRLINTNGLKTRGQKVDCIYHINLDILLQVLENHHRSVDLMPLIVSGRLRSISSFFEDLKQEFGTSHG